MASWYRTLHVGGGALALLLAVACGGDSPGAPDAGVADARAQVDAADLIEEILCASTAGTRLTRDYIEPFAGARQELEIIDTELGEPCSFSVEADGSYTCYPTDFDGQIFFQDSGCTSAIVGVVSGRAPKTFARALRLSDGGCFLGRHYRRIGLPSAVTGGQAVFVQNTAGTCLATTAPNRDYYLAGAELPLASFVSASRSATVHQGRLSAATFEGSDGSSLCDLAGSLTDSTLGQACAPGLGLDSETYCVPNGRSITDVFTNAGCTEEAPAVIVDRCEDDPPAFASTPEPLTCGQVSARLRTVGTTALAQRFEDVSGVCVADSGSDRFFPVGDEVADSEFVLLSTVLEAGADRLQRQLVVDGEGFRAFAGSWHDSTLGSDCTFGAAVDGSFRCLPAPLRATNFFSDALCTETIQLAPLDGCQNGRAFFALPATLGTRVLASEPHSEPVFIREGAVCNPASGSFLVPGFELAPSSFVQAAVSQL